MQLYQNLEWLPERSDATPAISEAAFADARTLRLATGVRLNEGQLRKLHKRRHKLDEAPKFLTPLSVVILSNANFELIEETIAGAGFRYGLDLDVVVEPMGSIAAAAMDEGSMLNAKRRDFVVIALTPEYFGVDLPIGDQAAADAFIDQAMGDVNLVAGRLRETGGQLLVQTVPDSFTNILGSIDRRTAGTPMNLIQRFNDRLAASGVPCVDTAALSVRIGLANWSSSHYWNWAKLPFHPNNNVAYADCLVRALATFRGGTKKCLVLDLDNTLWKGVIGDDGMEGIEIGNNSPTGEAHLAIHKLALMLKARGVVLAVCSKNDHAVAIEPFEAHAEMLLRANDFAVFQANWNDKASNVQAIAEGLSLGTDSFVFLDDNPMERDIVRRELPEVAVPEVPGDNPGAWPEIIAAAGYFDAYAFTDTDRDRAQQYTENAQREQLRVVAKDLTSYLRSLAMSLVVQPFSADTRSRVSQLINRSNQFNLTTRRYSEAEVKAAEEDDDALTFSFRLKDRFGDNGIIAVIICRREVDDVVIDTWLMSCRVLKRNVEEACLNEVMRAAKAVGASRVVGDYAPTAKNDMVREHYGRLGFTLIETAADGATRWSRSVADFEPLDAVMTVERVEQRAKLAEPVG